MDDASGTADFSAYPDGARLCTASAGLLGMADAASPSSRGRTEGAVRSDLPVSRIAQEVGIQNTTHFYRIFQNYYGMTPGEFRSTQ